MCGIAGFIAFSPESRLEARVVERMRDVMAHRGPDGAGLWMSTDGQAGLAHRRLSIIDLSTAASQPMVSGDGQVALVFNGEIYNHAEIRRELVAAGVGPWRTDHSDTEMILQAFRKWGIACLEKFRGMFALAIWDARARELWLVRDRRGVKPLYWTVQAGRLTFASEIKALLQVPGQPREIDPTALYHYLSFLTTPAPQTLFRGIRKLPAGGLVRVTAGGKVEERQWYELLDRVKPVEEKTEADVAARLLSELRESVALRKVSDVPVGIFLSGGIDSSTNAALFSVGESRRVKTFCIGYRGSSTYANETEYARRMAERVGAEHHELLLTIDDLISFVPRMIELQDEPIADPVCVPVYYVSKLARENGIVVAQVGEGSDELFCGYGTWKSYLNLARWNDVPVPAAGKRLGLALARRMGWSHSPQYEFLRRGAAGEPVFWSGAEAFRETEKQEMLGPALRGRLAGFSSWEALRPMHERFRASLLEQSHLNWMTYADLSLRLPELLLMRVDKMSMGVSLEGRVPFLDHRFVEYSMGIPTAMKLAGGESKHILKRAVRGIIPDEIIDRPKQGFGVPVHEWFLQRLGPQIRESVGRFVRETGLLDRAVVDRMLQAGRGNDAWYLYNLAEWWARYIAPPA
ncbi:MAG TPA: asparagine synthase (glutamine-hydrolyzing) [Candidatus Didemnitutus sp.]|nr:asparagine synthase (glutamine-hydrolyzing) [Candidatus Didemnitutus sp.]